MLFPYVKLTTFTCRIKAYKCKLIAHVKILFRVWDYTVREIFVRAVYCIIVKLMVIKTI